MQQKDQMIALMFQMRLVLHLKHFVSYTTILEYLPGEKWKWTDETFCAWDSNQRISVIQTLLVAKYLGLLHPYSSDLSKGGRS